MLRHLYCCALRLHPSGFRKRFGDEMLSIFDHTPSTGHVRSLASVSASPVIRAAQQLSELSLNTRGINSSRPTPVTAH